MPTRTHDQNTLLHGSWNAICDVCGFKYKAVDLKKRWDGLYVCKEDWEPRHPSDFFKGTAEDTGVAWARTDTAESGGADIEGTPFPAAENVEATNVGYVPRPYQNLVLYSEDFSSWVSNNNEGGTNVIVTSNTATSPNGTLTADTLEDDSIISWESMRSNDITPKEDEIYTGSVYILKDGIGKATRHVGIRLWFQNGFVSVAGATTTLDTNTGEYLAKFNDIDVLVGGGVMDAGDYWRVWVSAKNPNSSVNRLRCFIYPAYGDTTLDNVVFTATGTTTVWGAMVTEGPVLRPYVKTDGSGVVTTL